VSLYARVTNESFVQRFLFGFYSIILTTFPTPSVDSVESYERNTLLEQRSSHSERKRPTENIDFLVISHRNGRTQIGFPQASGSLL
jgi:hypothetical protein